MAYRLVQSLLLAPALALYDVGNHPIQNVWEDDLAFKVLDVLESLHVDWTSTDVVRIGYNKGSAPVVLWIGVTPSSLSGDDAARVVSKCRDVLLQYNLGDVDVEIRESGLRRSMGPKLLEPAFSHDPVVDLQIPLTATLGMPICAKSMPWAQGTGGLFLEESGGAQRRFLVTARHVVFPSSGANHYAHNTGQRRHDVVLFGDRGFLDHGTIIQVAIGNQGLKAENQEARMKASKQSSSAKAIAEHRDAQACLKKAHEAMDNLESFYAQFTAYWFPVEARHLGHVVLSPPIDVGVGKKVTRQVP